MSPSAAAREVWTATWWGCVGHAARCTPRARDAALGPLTEAWKAAGPLRQSQSGSATLSLRDAARMMASPAPRGPPSSTFTVAQGYLDWQDLHWPFASL